MHDSITTVIANMISLAKKATPYPIIQHLKLNTAYQLPFLLDQWYYHKKFPKQCTKNVRVYAEKAQKIKSAYHCTYM